MPRPILSTVPETLISVDLFKKKNPMGFKLPSVVVSGKVPPRLVEDMGSGNNLKAFGLFAKHPLSILKPR